MAAPFTGRPTAKAVGAILTFWFEETKPYQWFRRDLSFDQTIRYRFGQLHKAVRTGRLDVWRTSPRPSLARIILLDQFSRNIYRDDARAFAQDELALAAAKDAIARRFDNLFAAKERAFFYLPFMHAEHLGEQEECVRHFKTHMPGSMNVPFAKDHCAIVRRFGRFPHRNKVFGRASTLEEIQFLRHGGFNP